MSKPYNKGEILKSYFKIEEMFKKNRISIYHKALLKMKHNYANNMLREAYRISTLYSDDGNKERYTEVVLKAVDFYFENMILLLRLYNLRDNMDNLAIVNDNILSSDFYEKELSQEYIYEMGISLAGCASQIYKIGDVYGTEKQKDTALAQSGYLEAMLRLITIKHLLLKQQE